jgi:hypothetical protein
MRRLCFCFRVLVPAVPSGPAQAQKMFRIPPTHVRTAQLCCIQDEGGARASWYLNLATWSLQMQAVRV